MQARNRDGNVCIFTGQIQSDVCHIIPFAINSTAANLQRTERNLLAMVQFLSEEDGSELNKLLASKLGCSDAPWNMITLSPNLHEAWSSMKCGFVYMGHVPAVDEVGQVSSSQVDVKVQLRWLPRFDNLDAALKPFRKVDIDRLDFEQELLEQIPNDTGAADADAAGKLNSRHSNDGNSAFNTANGHNLRSGTLAKIRVSKEDTDKMRIMLQLQWACLKVLHLSGGADPEDLSPDNDEPEGEAQTQVQRAVSGWLEQLPAPKQVVQAEDKRA